MFRYLKRHILMATVRIKLQFPSKIINHATYFSITK